jgi:nucleoside-diphosphate-sugar epimerase
MTRRVLVTGGAGFIGRHCLPALLRSGYEVHAISRRPPVGCDRLRWHRGDLLEPGIARTLANEIHPSHLLHLGWCTEPGVYWTSPENSRWLDASLALVREFADAGGQRLVCAGSCAEYDWRSGVCVEAVTALRPASLYGQCKVALHHRLQEFAAQNGLGLGWARIFFPYGPFEPAARLVPSVIIGLLRRETVRCTAGTQLRDFIHVDDVAAALVTLLDRDVCGAVNIASGEAVSVRYIVSTIAGIVGGSERIEFGALPIRENDPPQLSAGTSRLTVEAGWQPSLSLADGLSNTVEWWRGRLSL